MENNLVNRVFYNFDRFIFLRVAGNIDRKVWTPKQTLGVFQKLLHYARS